MGVITRKHYRSGTFIIVDNDNRCDIFYQTKLQTLKVTWADTAYPQHMMLRDISLDIKNGSIATISDLYASFHGKLTIIQVNHWYDNIIGKTKEPQVGEALVK